jgi:hypothetical protein
MAQAFVDSGDEVEWSRRYAADVAAGPCSYTRSTRAGCRTGPVARFELISMTG